MEFKALQALEGRINDISLLLEAQDQLIRFYKIKELVVPNPKIESKSKNRKSDPSNSKTGEFDNVKNHLQIVTSIVDIFSDRIKPGRPPIDVEAINKAAYVLCVAHFQGFIDDLFREVAQKIISKKIQDKDELEKIVNSLAENKSNPRVDIINKLFSTIGFYNIVDEIFWQKTSSDTVKNKIREMIETRNKIAHGKSVIINNQEVRIDRNKVEKLRDFIKFFSECICDVIKKKF